MTPALDNPNPSMFQALPPRPLPPSAWDDAVEDPIDAREVFDLVRGIRDPEFPNSLEELDVVALPSVECDGRVVSVHYRPTVPQCGMAGLIGICIAVKLKLSLPSTMKIMVQIAEGFHSDEVALNKQLADKERVAAALENPMLMATVNKLLAHSLG